MKLPADTPSLRRLHRLIAVLACAVVPLVARAQFPVDPPPEAGLNAGSLRVFPILGLSYEYNDNFLYHSADDPANVRASNILTGLAGGVLSIPVSNSDVRFGLARRDRGYTDDPSTGAWYGMASARLLFSRGHLLRLEDEYEDGELDAQAFRGAIPGVPSSGEIVVTGEPYRRNGAKAELVLSQGARGRSAVRYQNEIIRFTGDRESGFYDLTGHTLDSHGALSVGGASYLLWSAEIARDDLSRPDSPPPPGGGPPVYPADEARQRAVSARIGWERGFGIGGRLTLYAGAVNAESVAAARFSYTGAVGSVEYLRDIPTRVYATAGYYRNVYPSPFNSADLFLSDSVVLRIARPTTARLVCGGEVSGTRNDYQTTGGGRVDDVLFLQGWIGWRWSRDITWRVFAAHTERQSTLPGFDFDVNRIGTTLAWGL
jgi:hypothetical protein